MKIVIYILIILVILYLLLRCIYLKKLLSMNKEGKYDNENVNYLYDDYYLNSKNKSSNKLSNNLELTNSLFYKSKYLADIHNLELNNNDGNNDKYNKNNKIKILSVYTLNCNLEIELVSKFDNIEIVVFCNNLFNIDYLNNKINKLDEKVRQNISVSYGEAEDISNIISNLNTDYLFDRIIVNECLGNIKNRNIFFSKCRKMLKDNTSFIYIKTFVFNPIFINENNHNYDNKNDYIKKMNYTFDRQKKIIDYWNYNFSTKQAIINELHNNNFSKINYNQIPLVSMVFLYNINDIIKILNLYFVDMKMGTKNLHEWLYIKDIKILNLKIRK